MAMTWEYRVAPVSREQVENQLNFLGEEGWELVQVIVMNNPEIPYQAIFKRIKGAR
jgi:hypothetical protein